MSKGPVSQYIEHHYRHFNAAALMDAAKGYVTVQCKGLTKSGTRCKHMTRIANGYCFQHQPD